MDDVQSYTDTLRRTYRQSLDVVLPFTNHEAVVYCNEDEFESYLEDKHSVKDLQACIYLLERHIDLQQEIIQGLTRLQEVHKYDERPSEYNVITDKLLSAHNKLAVLRSRTVRCLTKQIELRCGDSSMQLNPWSENPDTQPTQIRRKNASQPDETPTMVKSKSHSSTIYEQLNGFENGEDFSSNFDNTDAAFLKINSSAQGKSEVLQTSSEHLLEKKGWDQKLTGVPASLILEKDRNLDEDTITTNLDSDDIEAKNSQENSRTDNIENTPKPINAEKINGNPEITSNAPGVQLFLNVSNIKPEEIAKGESPRGRRRHILEPVEEKITVEVLQAKSCEVDSVEKKNAQDRCNAPNTIDEHYHSNTSKSEKFGDVTEKKSMKSEFYAPHPIHEDSHTNTTEMSSEHLDLILSSEVEETSSNSSVNRTVAWDPSLLIKKILGKVKPIQADEPQSVNDEVIHMAGYLEKLPVNQKKATLLKSWRKRYFKILHGKLFYFEDHRAAAPISFIKLGGSQVVEVGSKCLEVTENEDLGGKLLVIRCASWPELQDWRKALESEAKIKVKRQHFELVQEKKSVIIIDFGSSSIKAGFLEDQAWPQVIIPSVYAVNKDDKKSRFYGYEALHPAVRNTSKLVYPLRSPLTVGKYVLDPNDLIGFLEIIFKDLKVDPSHYQIVMATPVNLRDLDKERLVEILFDVFQVASVYMKCQTVLSMYSYSATSGIVVNIGDHTDVVPVEEGYIVESGINSFPYGGRQVTDHFMRLLSSSGYRYFSEVENYIAEYLKVKTCYVSQNFTEETKQFSESDCLTVDMSEFVLPSGDKLVTVAKERFTAYEGLFKPELWGKDTPGIHEMVYDAVMACSIDNRKEMCRNIFLSGSTTKVPGFAERLRSELSQKFPSSLTIQVHASADRQFAAFIGAAVLASLESFNDLCITCDEWEETGPELLKKWDSV